MQMQRRDGEALGVVPCSSPAASGEAEHRPKFHPSPYSADHHIQEDTWDGWRRVPSMLAPRSAGERALLHKERESGLCYPILHNARERK